MRHGEVRRGEHGDVYAYVQITRAKWNYAAICLYLLRNRVKPKCSRVEQLNYHAARDDPQESGGEHRAEELRRPVEHGACEGDAPADEQAEGDGRVDVPARRVDGQRHRSGQRERVRYRHHEQAANRPRVRVHLPCQRDQTKFFRVQT
jgi:hypothetical protein